METVEALAGAGSRKLVLDFSDSKGCGDHVADALACCWGRYRKLGGRIVACGMDRTIWGFFHVAKLEQIVAMYPTEEEAVASFANP